MARLQKYFGCNFVTLYIYEIRCVGVNAPIFRSEDLLPACDCHSFALGDCVDGGRGSRVWAGAAAIIYLRVADHGRALERHGTLFDETCIVCTPRERRLYVAPHWHFKFHVKACRQRKWRCLTSEPRYALVCFYAHTWVLTSTLFVEYEINAGCVYVWFEFEVKISGSLSQRMSSPAGSGRKRSNLNDLLIDVKWALRRLPNYILLTATAAAAYLLTH